MGNFANFVNPETIHTLGLGERIVTSLFVTVLGMGITFAALVAIWGMTVLMSKIITGFETKNSIAQAATVEKAKAAPAPAAPAPAAATGEPQEDENLIAVLTAAIAASLNTSMHNIVVRNVRPLPDQTPSWSRAGRSEQMNTRF
ncbi:OadG family protein [Acidaminobacter hydrogenoformans]|uniref:Sodium pump decarboxylases, gamma subunit n=1 Tax=Acidaminobacter hydrogenoformans DSM 2784 TaxID=1120920 RepID=A0A1G5RPE8_9FIRM|nr:OadG family protein [Acidaminobacter hydrogenoformans]SCZ75982.1 sodium pump decarboxylases, gamma subunit [Acidaminobacter hydrogenoformans DSM 2784]